MENNERRESRIFNKIFQERLLTGSICVTTSWFVCLTLHRSIFNMSEFGVRKILLIEKMQLKKMGVPYNFHISILRRPRIEASFMSREGKTSGTKGV